MSPGGKASRAKGDRFEYRVRDDMKARGWGVRRAPASAFPDFWALEPVTAPGRGPKRIAFIECKFNGRLDPKDWNALYAEAAMFDADPVLASSPSRGKILYQRLIGPKMGVYGRDATLLDEWSP